MRHPGKTPKMLASRFWTKVDIREKSECWPWKSAINRSGYGQFAVSTGQSCKVSLIYAHRMAYHLTFGDIPPEMFVCHKCDNKVCCNPEHLFLGTNLDNMQDASKKGKLKKVPKKKQDLIHSLYEEGKTFADISRVIGINASTVRHVALRIRGYREGP